MENRDEHLWRIAKKRAGFKKQLASYLIINGFLWVMWFLTQGKYGDIDDGGFPWPIWCSLGWGIGLAFSYYGAYHDNRESDTMKEYQKLKDRDGR
ncbi:MAG: 2TM domain-containing protein [Bacteroidetes bacterium]|nr:2TM domain-containing protein [Bacteroidota bacterium]